MSHNHLDGEALEAARQRALNFAAQAYADERNAIMDQVLWDKFGRAGMKAEEILTKAAGHLADRAKTYDRPQGERSMEKTVQMFNTLAGTQLTTEQGWLFMVILKMVRSQQGDYKADNYEDGAAYFALAGERTSGPKKRDECYESYPRPVQTRRQQLISAGIPAHEFDGITEPDLDAPADATPSQSLASAFGWSNTKQGHDHWEKWESLLD
jgi:hypothetical protein